MPHGGLPHLRKRLGFGQCQLPTRTARAARPGQSANLLLPTEGRRCNRLVTGNWNPTARILAKVCREISRRDGANCSLARLNPVSTLVFLHLPAEGRSLAP